jgi:hypothetical protein
MEQYGGTRPMATVEDDLPGRDYNFDHFQTKHLWSDIEGTIMKRGIRPGMMVPDFNLPSVSGGSVRLSELSGKPALLHFGSPT